MQLISSKSKGSYTESFTAIKTSIRYSFTDKDKKTFVITSANAGDGKTNIAINLAISLATDEMKTLLVDCSLMNHKIDKTLKINNSFGISDVLLGRRKLEQTIKKYKNNLDVLPAGNTSENPSELLGKEKMQTILEELKNNYDYIIIDTPQVRKFSDARILSSMCDGVILVARYENTEKDSLVECKKILEHVGGNLIGVVLNRVRVK